MNKIILTNKNYSCCVLNEYGAALNSYKYKEKEFVQGYKSLDETEVQKYKGVLLAPFPNRVAKGKFTFNNVEFQLPINRPKEVLALHGFLYNKHFKIVEQKENFVILQYTFSKKLSSFPFSFSITVVYELLISGTLKIKTIVKNIGEKTMPFGTGWHPYFIIDNNIESMKLKMPACKKMETQNNIPTEKMFEFLNQESILNLKEYHFDDCFVFEKSEININLIGKKFQLKVSARCQNNYPYFQIYTPKTRDSIAIEPMSCAPNAFNNKIGLLKIEANQSFSFEYSIFASEI